MNLPADQHAINEMYISQCLSLLSPCPRHTQYYSNKIIHLARSLGKLYDDYK